MWNGLVGGYYRQRWDILFNEALASVQENRAYDADGVEARIKAFETGWNEGTEVYPARPKGDTRRIARRIQRHIDAWTETGLPG